MVDFPWGVCGVCPIRRKERDAKAKARTVHQAGVGSKYILVALLFGAFGEFGFPAFCQSFRLFDPFVTHDPALELEAAVDPFDFGLAPCGDLIKVIKAQFVQGLFERRTNTL